MKSTVLTSVIMALFLSTASAGGLQENSAPLALSLEPVKASYTLEDAGRGNVTITAIREKAGWYSGTTTRKTQRPDLCRPTRTTST
ncbi:MAG TPA: hypothetical protein VGB23_08800 [Nitrospirota bacterium]